VDIGARQPPPVKVAGPAEILIGMYMQIWQSYAILAAVNLGIADELAEAHVHIDALASSLSVHPQSLFRLLRALSSRGLFKRVGPALFANNALSRALQQGAPGGAREIIRSLGLPSTRVASVSYQSAITTGRPALEFFRASLDVFERIGTAAEESSNYDAGMTAAAFAEVETIISAFDFSRFVTLVDMGGGQGTLLGSILARNPNQQGILFDRPKVVAASRHLLERLGVRERCKACAGDFRQDLPRGGDAYILKNVLHGYSDEVCRDLLQRIRECAPPEVHILIIELVMPEENPTARHAMFDLFLLMGGAQPRVRSEADFRELLLQTGFELLRMVPTSGPLHVIEARATTWTE
jgi:C-methyltransferase